MTGNQVWIGDRRQIHILDAAAELTGQLGRSLYREPCFTDAARAGQRHNAVFGQQVTGLVQLRLASNKTRQLNWKMLFDNGFSHPQRRESVNQVGMAELRHPLRARQIAQRVGAQIGQPGIDREPVSHQVLGCAR